MGVTLYISLDRAVPGLEPNGADGTVLAQLIGEPAGMDAACRHLGVPSLTGFQSYDPAGLSEFIDDPAELAAAMATAKPIEWFDATAALPAVRMLPSYYAVERVVNDRGRRRGGVWEPVDVTDRALAELKDVESVLSRAAAHGVRFRFHLGF
jgi:hypothetical protein